MNECYGNKFILNGKIQTSDTFDNSMIYEGHSIYEVLRMINGNPIFFDDHMERLRTSTNLQKKISLADSTELKKAIINLTKTDKRKEANLKIVFNYKEGSDNYLVYYIESLYPTEEQYKKGVKGTLFKAERKDPESKVINHKLRSAIYHKLMMEGAYEALLVNDDNCITEGSRSNVFFIKDNALYTAPENLVLSGITRKYILEICRENNIKVIEKCINSNDISEYDALIMTGTSPMVLPYNSLGKIQFRVNHPYIRMLRELYIKKAEESILEFRKTLRP